MCLVANWRFDHRRQIVLREESSCAQGPAGALHAVSSRLYIFLTHQTCPENAFWGAVDRVWPLRAAVLRTGQTPVSPPG